MDRLIDFTTLHDSTESPLDDPSHPEYWWWLKTTWRRHRHAAVKVHPLLVYLQEARGWAFMTVEHVVAVLNAKDPDALVERWVAVTPPSRSLGLPHRTC